ncbi:MAG TPA: DUF3732 domain-containing protein [Ktedonobacterales bacterium]
MEWYIRDIIIYGQGDDLRQLSFQPGVNIITGDSQTGKSALIAIVDYCMGAREYEVPVGVIREFARWYAIRLQTPAEQIFIARREPGGRRTSDQMHMIVQHEVELPHASQLTANSSREAVIGDLSRRLGMMDQSLALSEYDHAWVEPPTARNVVPFLFQPQGVIANKDQLFYKTDEERHREHRQRLQRIFPYVLGAINAEYFQLKGALDATKRELRQQERLLNERQALAGDGVNIALSLWQRAIALGLVGAEQQAPSTELDERTNLAGDLAALRLRLATLVESASVTPLQRPLVAGDPERAAALDSQSREIRNEIAALRQQLSYARELAGEATDFAGALRLQRGRLRAVNIVPQLNAESAACPVCNQPVAGIVPAVERIRAANQAVEAELDAMATVSPALSRHIANVESVLSVRRAALAQVESELAQLYLVQADASSAEAAWAEQQRLIGAIRLYLDQVPAAPHDTADLQRRSDELRRRADRLEHDLEGFDSADRLESALILVAQFMSSLRAQLHLERQDAALRLDIKRLTVVRTSPAGRPERLNEIGSGENWVGYHLCALFALHTFFLRVGSPVPAFLFLDQPSQIYFPQEGTGAGASEAERTDWEAVSNIYRMIFGAVEALHDQLQVIVVDHANLQTPAAFQSAIRYNWRNGQKLI